MSTQHEKEQKQTKTKEVAHDTTNETPEIVAGNPIIVVYDGQRHIFNTAELGLTAEDSDRTIVNAMEVALTQKLGKNAKLRTHEIVRLEESWLITPEATYG